MVQKFFEMIKNESEETEKIASGSNTAREETNGSRVSVDTTSSTVIIQNRLRRLSRKSESLDDEIPKVVPEGEVVNFGPEDTIIIVKGGIIEGHTTVTEIADAINECTRKDNGEIIQITTIKYFNYICFLRQ